MDTERRRCPSRPGSSLSFLAMALARRRSRPRVEQRGARGAAAGARDRRAARLGAPHLRRHRAAQPGADRSLALRRGPGALGVRERLAQDGRPPLPRIHQVERRSAGRPGRRDQRLRAGGLHSRRREHGQGSVRAARRGEGRRRQGALPRGRCVALRAQLAAQPRTADGGFWHKQIYPHQMWADGVYMASPFLAKYAAVFGEPAALDDAVKQVLLAEAHLRDAKTGLLFHGWDESKTERWANRGDRVVVAVLGTRRSGGTRWRSPTCSPRCRATIRSAPAVVAVLRRLARALAQVQDRQSGVWWQVLDAGGRPRNFKEASATAMFVYALAKGRQQRLARREKIRAGRRTRLFRDGEGIHRHGRRGRRARRRDLQGRRARGESLPGRQLRLLRRDRGGRR